MNNNKEKINKDNWEEHYPIPKKQEELSKCCGEIREDWYIGNKTYRCLCSNCHKLFIPKKQEEQNYSHLSHTHCWNNPKNPCNINIQNHTQCCLCDMKYKQEESTNWEIEFDKCIAFVGSPEQYYNNVKDFITSLLSKQKEEIKEGDILCGCGTGHHLQIQNGIITSDTLSLSTL